MKKQLFFGFKSPKVNRGLVMTESVITASILSIAVMTPFFNSIGMSQEEIAISQMACVAVLMATNIPMGWVADRFSRASGLTLSVTCCAEEYCWPTLG